MKVVCIKTKINRLVWHDVYEDIDLIDYITLGKIYDTLPNPASRWVWNIIDDRGRPHDISKECFTRLRDVNINKILNV